MEKNDSFTSLFFLLFVLAVYIISFLKARRKNAKPPAAPPPQKKVVVPQVKKQVVPPPKVVLEKVDQGTQTSTGTPRIRKMVNDLPSKRNLVILGEILKPLF